MFTKPEKKKKHYNLDFVINSVTLVLDMLAKKCQAETQIPFKCYCAFTGNISNKLHLEK